MKKTRRTNLEGMAHMLKSFRKWFSKEGHPLKLSNIDVTSGTDASTRLSSAGRRPINIWGDVMLDGADPQIRRVLTGQDAHESLLSFFYFAEILSLDDVISSIPKRNSHLDWPTSVLERYELLKGSSRDPQNQLNDELLQVFIPIALFIKLIGQDNTELCELGCTLFSAIEKLEICAILLDTQLDIAKFSFAAVDHSEHFLRGAMKLHRDHNVVPFRNYTDWLPSKPYPLHLSRFVASYATSSAEELASWLQTFSAFHLIDVFSISQDDFVTSNNGLRQTFFNFPKLIGYLNAAGWCVYANSIEPDFNSGRRCAVIKLFGIKREVQNIADVLVALRAHDELSSLFPMEQMTEQTAVAAIERVSTTLSKDEWTALAAYKKHFPIWGRPISSLTSIEDVEALISSPKQPISLHFESGQVNYYVSRALGEQR
jgi:hypothetical protein